MYVVGVGADVDHVGFGFVVEELLGGAVADNRGPVEVSGEGQRVEDADDGELLLAEPQLVLDRHVSNAQPFRRDSPQHRGRKL